jgi:N-acetylmuramoyl-L-alanine amidase
LAPTTTTTAPAPTTTAAPAPPPTIPTAGGVLTLGAAGADARSAPGGPVVEHLRGGVVLPLEVVQGEWARVETPCESHFWVPVASGTPTKHTTIVLDPGHGGTEAGAVGTGGLAEREVNLDVTRRVADKLRADGIDSVLTHPGQYNATLAFRGAVAAALKPSAFVSIHHNSEPDGPKAGPGSETYYQFHSPASKRLAGLLYEEIVPALAPFGTQWVADRDAGAKWRLGSAGRDYYAMLRIPGQAGIPASLAELAFISNPAEEALLRLDTVKQAEADAIARAIVRYLRTSDGGSGFTTPYDRTEPAGGGGGKAGCTDPS